jgi:hypothetical protein
MEDLRAVKREWSERLLRPSPVIAEGARAFAAAATPAPEQNVVGVGIGEKFVAGQPTGVRSLKFLVRRKYAADQISAAQRLPKSVEGLPADVEQVGLLRAFPSRTVRRPRAVEEAEAAAGRMPNPRIRRRPARPGCSIGFREPNDHFVMAGTFGALVKDSAGTYVLSNNHVLADENRLPSGAPIFQPGLLDNGNANTDRIAKLTRFAKLRPAVMNKVDAAIAQLDRTTLATNSVLHIGPPEGTATAEMDMIVHKFGRTTGYRVGQVTSVDTDVSVRYETGTFTFEGQILIVGINGLSFSDSGDSGSLILERSTAHAIGLLFAGSSSHTIANHIADVLQALKVSLV